MNKTVKLYLITFLGIGLVILLFGYIGINVSLKYIENHYIQLQIDVNKRQAERMAFVINNEIKNGISLDSIKNDFQASIVGTEHDKGFLCMYDTKQMQLISHPDSNAIGMSFTQDFVFKDVNSNNKLYIGDIYNTKKPAGGIFVQGNMRTDIIYTIPIKGTDWYLNAHENITAINDEIKQLRIRYIFGALVLGFIIALMASVTARRISRTYEKQIEQKNKEIIKQHKEIERKNKGITDSINYAEKIQAAVFPNLNILESYSSEHFIIYRPKDIVSGDFYWFTKINDLFIVAAADCTGHGVPGAFMSMLGITLLNEIVNNKQITDAKDILNELRNEIKLALRQTGDYKEQKDGMDIALCVVNNNKNTLQYAGANNPLYLIRDNEIENNFELKEFKADRMPIGVYPKDNISFKNNDIDIQVNDSIYIFSDGITSQFGGEDGSTFKSKRLQNLLLTVQHENMENQKLLINRELSNWQRNYEQVDDIIIIGLKLT